MTSTCATTITLHVSHQLARIEKAANRNGQDRTPTSSAATDQRGRLARPAITVAFVRKGHCATRRH
jgi:hypothetical protein